MENTFSNIIHQYIMQRYYSCAISLSTLKAKIQNETSSIKIQWEIGLCFLLSSNSLVWQWTTWVNLTQVLKWPTEQHDKSFNGHYNVSVVSKYGSPTIKQVVTVWPFNFLQTIFVYISIDIKNPNTTANALKLSLSYIKSHRTFSSTTFCYPSSISRSHY